MQTVNNDAGSMNDTNKGAIYDGETFAEAFDAASSVTPAGSLNADVNVDSNAGRGGRLPIGKIAVVLSVVIIIGVLSIVGYRYNEHLEQAYAEAERRLVAFAKIMTVRMSFGKITKIGTMMKTKRGMIGMTGTMNSTKNGTDGIPRGSFGAFARHTVDQAHGGSAQVNPVQVNPVQVGPAFFIFIK